MKINKECKQIELKHISKKYKQKEVLKNITIKFNEGKCYLLVGGNGAGKSTMLKIILGLVFYQKDLKSCLIKRNIKEIGYVPEKIGLPMNISILDFLLLISNIKNDSMETVNRYLKYWDLEKQKNKKIKELSKGMLQKILIIQAFLGNPDVLIFDEALNGLDPMMQNRLLELIKLKKEKKIIIITSHYPDCYNSIVDERITIHEGKIIAIEKIN